MASNDNDTALSAFDPALLMLEIRDLSEEERRRHLHEYLAASRREVEAIFKALT